MTGMSKKVYTEEANIIQAVQAEVLPKIEDEQHEKEYTGGLLDQGGGCCIL
jgi:hypothetical protein